MNYPEYLNLFSGQGDYKVQVHFKGNVGPIAGTAMMINELNLLIDPSIVALYAKMYFDDHLLNVYKYEIDPVKKTLKIKVISD